MTAWPRVLLDHAERAGREQPEVFGESLEDECRGRHGAQAAHRLGRSEVRHHTRDGDKLVPDVNLTPQEVDVSVAQPQGLTLA